MRLSIFTFLFSYILFLPTGQALVNTCCVCQTGLEPKLQTLAFEAGCELWLLKQEGCNYKLNTPADTNLSKDLPESCNGGLLVLGYVGHWLSGKTEEYIKDYLAPLMKERDVSISYNNTACNSLQDSESLVDMIRELALPIDHYLEVEGNQTISVGMWAEAGILASTANLTMNLDVREDEISIRYPSCDVFEGRRCFEFAQAGQKGRCQKVDNSGYKELTCCVKKKFSRYMKKRSGTYIWHGNNCEDDQYE